MNHIQNKFINILEDLTKEISVSFNFYRDDKQQLCVMGYYSSIIENTAACAHMMSRPAFSGLPIVIRANIESLLDLKNSIENPDYYKRLRATYLKQRSYYFKSKFQRVEEKHGSSSDKYKEHKSQYDEVLNLLKQYKSNGNNPIGIREKFELLDSEEDHETSYSSFCLEVHNDISVVEKKHVVNDETGIPNIAMFKERSELDKKVFLKSPIGILQLATKEVVDFLDIENEKVSEILSKLKSLQESIDGSEI